MSILLMGRVFYTDLPSNLRLTMLALADFADDDGGSLFVGQRHLGLRIGAGERTVRNHLAELVRLTYLLPVDRVGQHGTKRYQIVVAHLPTDVEISAQKRLLRDSRPADMAGRDLAADSRPATGDQLDRKAVSILDRKPASYKPSVVQPSDKPSGSSLARTSSRAPDPLFESLFAVWIGKPYQPGRDGLTPTARGKLNHAVAELRAAGATVEQVQAIPAAWVLLWPGPNPPTLTPAAAASHWPALLAAMERAYVARGTGSVADALGAALDRQEAETLEGMHMGGRV